MLGCCTWSLNMCSVTNVEAFGVIEMGMVRLGGSGAHGWEFKVQAAAGLEIDLVLKPSGDGERLDVI